MEIAKDGTEGLLENMRGLNQIKEKMDLIASNIIQLSNQSQLIGEITATVEDIANQSNMLAVNASIEAVKAGEQGKGFEVVAKAIREHNKEVPIIVYSSYERGKIDMIIFQIICKNRLKIKIWTI